MWIQSFKLSLFHESKIAQHAKENIHFCILDATEFSFVLRKIIRFEDSISLLSQNFIIVLFFY